MPINEPNAKNVLLVEGNDKRDLLSLLLEKNNKLNLESYKGKTKNFLEDNTVQIITINEVDKKDHIKNFIQSPKYDDIENLAIIVDAEDDAEKRFNLFKDIICCDYNKCNSIYFNNAIQNNKIGLFLSTEINNKNQGCLEDLVKAIILEKDKDLFENCVEEFFKCAEKLQYHQGNNNRHILKSQLLAFISVKCKRRNTIGGLFQEYNDYLNSSVLDDLICFLVKIFK